MDIQLTPKCADYQSAVVYWSLIENSVAVVSTTLPALRPVIWAAASEIRSRGSTMGISLRSSGSATASTSASGSPTSSAPGGTGAGSGRHGTWASKGERSWPATRLADEDEETGGLTASPSLDKDGASHFEAAEIELHGVVVRGHRPSEKEMRFTEMV
jgi:hypothetical protein